MSSISNTQALLELPDPSSDLFPQVLLHRSLKHFTLFPHLPQEIRLKIWRFTFRNPRRIDLSYPIPSLSLFWYRGGRPYGALLPITLSINHESRYEAIRNFAVIIHNPFLGVLYGPTWKEHPRPLVFRRNSDTIQFSWDCVFLNRRQMVTQDSWIGFVRNEAGPHCFENVKVVELSGARWRENVKVFIESYDGKSHSIAPFTWLTSFRGMEKLVVKYDDRFLPVDISYDVGQRPTQAESECKASVEGLLKRLLAAGCFRSGKMPEVEVVYCPGL